MVSDWLIKTNIRVVFAFPRPVIISCMRRLHRWLFSLATLFTLLCFAHIVQQLAMTVRNHAINDIMAVQDNTHHQYFIMFWLQTIKCRYINTADTHNKIFGKRRSIKILNSFLVSHFTGDLEVHSTGFAANCLECTFENKMILLVLYNVQLVVSHIPSCTVSLTALLINCSSLTLPNGWQTIQALQQYQVHSHPTHPLLSTKHNTLMHITLPHTDIKRPMWKHYKSS